MEIIEKNITDDLHKLEKLKKLNSSNKKRNIDDIKSVDIKNYLDLVTFYNELFGHTVRKKKIIDKYMVL